MKYKKGAKAPSGSSAGALIGLILLVMIFYVIFLPPEDRAELLGETSPPGALPFGEGGSGNDPYNTKDPGRRGAVTDATGVIINENPGRLDVPEEVLPKYLPNVFIAETTQSQIIAKVAPIYIKNGVFDSKKATKEVSFTLKDLEHMDNVLLSFASPKRKGLLTIYLNGESVHEYVITKENPQPITIDAGLLRPSNTLAFMVDGVGIQFWKTNEYALENIQFTADVTDVTQQESRNIFVLTENEMDNIERALLRFIPYCGEQRNVGTLDVLLNNRPVFGAVPICDDPYFIPVSKNKLKEGENHIVFVTNKGRYTIEQIQLDFEEKLVKSNIHYFQMEPEWFLGFDVIVSEAKCGEIDGFCPGFCDEDIDIDCCFFESSDNYWCDIEPDDADDRCVSAIDENKCGRCISGYEDSRGDAPDACEDRCGDDEDGICPAGCDIHLDEDCCFEDNEDNYWCETLPTTGVSSICERALTSGECDDCKSGYRTESGRINDCDTGLDPILIEEENVLRPEFSAVLYIEFVDDNRDKDVDVVVNGRRFNIDQEAPFYSRDISDWVRPNNNYIELFPVTPLNIVELEVKIE